MNIHWLTVALLAISGPVLGADGLVLPGTDSLGFWLVAVGVALLVFEAALPNYGIAGLGGIVLCVIGAVILTNADLPAPLMLGLGLVSALLLIVLLVRALKTRPRQPVSGDATLLGSVTMVTALQAGNHHHGWVQLEGERWQVASATPLRPGQAVRVITRKGLLLEVAPADSQGV
ncbi:membrane-bound serine protease (ClpP class) [Pseudomonas sp. NFACC23-1]|uniref:NfeD family protein n=1 Tax=unclassified Pseudomonas TaxID=196821 RepID=UPI0008917145|nr:MULTISPECIES: NfeD family protein [unclassified Pseudomonas]SDB25869.1 membrane-bound serine protease (ClpP class) [Pseudomonas sp. NFACC17-2]SEJ38892.1 membrane-bound serine protease (ClpP class) [Pseudomonas sp. NFACC23-1]SFW53944.1 membrane-bound serine protease (ClpP class) [Pseudomonas sp. NFACC16-2]